MKELSSKKINTFKIKGQVRPVLSSSTLYLIKKIALRIMEQTLKIQWSLA